MLLESHHSDWRAKPGGHVDVARLLLDRSADVMQGTEKTALSPAHVAASRGHLEMLQAALGPSPFCLA